MPKPRRTPETLIKQPGISLYDGMSDNELMKHLASKLEELRLNFLNNEEWLFSSDFRQTYAKYLGNPLKNICDRLTKHPEMKNYFDVLLKFDEKIRQAIQEAEKLSVIEKTTKMGELLREEKELEEKLKQIKLGEAHETTRTQTAPTPNPTRMTTRSQTKRTIITEQTEQVKAQQITQHESSRASEDKTRHDKPTLNDKFKDEVGKLAHDLKSYKKAVIAANKKTIPEMEAEAYRWDFMNRLETIVNQAKKLKEKSAEIKTSSSKKNALRRLNRMIKKINSGNLPRFFSSRETRESIHAQREWQVKQTQIRKAEKDRKQLAKELKKAIKTYKEAAKYYKKGLDDLKNQDPRIVIAFQGELIADLASRLRPAVNEEKDIQELLHEAHLVGLQEEYRLLREQLKNQEKTIQVKADLPPDNTGYHKIIKDLKQYITDFDKLTGILRNLDNLSPGLMRGHVEDREFYPKHAKIRKKMIQRLRKLEADQAILDRRDQLPTEWARRRNKLFEKIPPFCEPLKKMFLAFEQEQLNQLLAFLPTGVDMDEARMLLKLQTSKNNFGEWIEDLDNNFDRAIQYFDAANEIMQAKFVLQSKLDQNVSFNRIIIHPVLEKIYQKHFEKISQQIASADPINFLTNENQTLHQQSSDQFRQNFLRRYNELENKSEKSFACFIQASDLLDKIADLKKKAKQLSSHILGEDQAALFQLRIEAINKLENSILKCMDPQFPKYFIPEEVKQQLKTYDYAIKFEKMLLQLEELNIKLNVDNSVFIQTLKSGPDIRELFQHNFAQRIIIPPELINQYATEFPDTEEYEEYLKLIANNHKNVLEIFKICDLLAINSQELYANLQKSKQLAEKIQYPELKNALNSHLVDAEFELEMANPLSILNDLSLGLELNTIDLANFNKAQIIYLQEIRDRHTQTIQCIQIADQLLANLDDLRLRLVAASSDQNSAYQSLCKAWLTALEEEKIKILKQIQDPSGSLVTKVVTLELMARDFDKDIKDKYEDLIWLMENGHEYLKNLNAVLLQENANDTSPKVRSLLRGKAYDLLDISITNTLDLKRHKNNILELHAAVTDLMIKNITNLLAELEKLLGAPQTQKFEYEGLIIGFLEIYNASQHCFKGDLQILFDRANDGSNTNIQNLLERCQKLHIEIEKKHLLEVLHHPPRTDADLKEAPKGASISSTFTSGKATIHSNRPLPSIPISLFSHEGLTLIKSELNNLQNMILKLSTSLHSDGEKLSKVQVEKLIIDILNLHKKMHGKTKELNKLLKLPEEIKAFEEIKDLMDALKINLHEENGMAKLLIVSSEDLLQDLSNTTRALDRIKEASGKAAPAAPNHSKG